MKKIGILTHYHDTVNYGGALQAYALCRVVEELGFCPEQIDIDCFAECTNLDYEPSNLKRVLTPILPLLKILRRLKRYKEIKRRNELLKIWRKSFFDFNNYYIPHTNKQYFKKTIGQIANEYYSFIVGSDQVWNPIWYFEPFFLTFAPDSAKKIAYAASVSQSILSEKAKRRYSEHFKSFNAISVREEATVELLSDLSDLPVKYVLDPTLLLPEEHWNTILPERLIEPKYIFCYFLGNDSKMRFLAKSFAKKKGFVVVNISHATAHYHTADLGFGDVKLNVPSPLEFLSLIKYAEYVFTDSFHAMVFSSVFKKLFFAFERENHSAMSTRIHSFAKLLSAENNICDVEEKMTVEYLESLTEIDYSISSTRIEAMRRDSIRFLQDSLTK